MKAKHFWVLFPLIFLIALFLTGCSLNLRQLLVHESDPVSAYPAANIYEDNGEIYNQTLSLIENAKSSIYIEQTVMVDSAIINALVQKSQEGLDVRIILDQWQTENRSTVELLKNQGVSVQYYPARKGQVDHVKLLITDDYQTLIYGAPWNQEAWSSHTLALKMDGKIAWRCAALFARDWEFTTTLSLPVPKSTDAPDDQMTLASNANIKQQILTKIKASKNSISLELTEISDAETVTALIDAAKKGVTVRAVLDLQQTKDAPEALATLRTGGIDIRFYPSDQKPLRVNYGIFDDNSFVFSSSGWTYAVFVMNHELSVTIPSPQAAARMSQHFEQDWSISS